MRIFMLFAAALFAFAGAAAAQTTNNQLTSIVARPNENLVNYDVETLQPLLAQMDIASEIKTLSDGGRYLSAQDSGGLRFVLHPRDCRDDGQANCKSVIMFAFFTGDHNPQTIAAFNAKSAAVGAYIDGSGNAVINRFDVAAFGMPRGTFAVTLVIFINNGVELYTLLRSTEKTVNTQGDETDLAAAFLNGRELDAFAGAASERGYAGFDDAYAAISVLKEKAALPFNRIGDGPP